MNHIQNYVTNKNWLPYETLVIFVAMDGHWKKNLSHPRIKISSHVVL